MVLQGTGALNGKLCTRCEYVDSFMNVMTQREGDDWACIPTFFFYVLWAPNNHTNNNVNEYCPKLTLGVG